MKNPKKLKPPDKDGNIPRQVRMPPVLDQWLEEEAAATDGRHTVADKIRECVAWAREAKLRESETEAA